MNGLLHSKFGLVSNCLMDFRAGDDSRGFTNIEKGSRSAKSAQSAIDHEYNSLNPTRLKADQALNMIKTDNDSNLTWAMVLNLVDEISGSIAQRRND